MWRCMAFSAKNVRSRRNRCFSLFSSPHRSRHARTTAHLVYSVVLPASATYTKIANNGALLAASATLGSGPTNWACSRDNATGLIWEVKTTSGLRGQDNTNYDSVYGTAAQIAAASNSLGFVAAVNAASLCGYGEWRRPGKEELQGISDLSFFPNTPRALFWTATPLAGDAASAYEVDFANAGVFADLRSLESGVFTGSPGSRLVD